MHIPDGPLSPEVCAVTGAISLAAVGYSLHRLKDSLADRAVPMTGMMAALIFAGQMVNFPIGLLGVPQVSGHLMGGVLAAAVLGPWAGLLAIALVLIVQSLLFADGGLLALGANILNMGVVGAWGGYVVYSTVRRAIGRAMRGGAVVGAVAASWLSVMAASSLFCLELRLSRLPGEYDYGRIFALMVTVHAVIGVGEALITGSVLSFVLRQRPDLIFEPQARGVISGAGRFVLAGSVCALAVAAFLAPFASEYDDGLVAVSKATNFDDLDRGPKVLLLDEYSVPLPVGGWENAAVWQKVSVSLAGLFGTGAVLVIALVLTRTLERGRPVAEPSRAE